MALTPDAVASNEEMVETFMDRIYEPHKAKIWGSIALLLAAVIAYLALREYRAARLDDMWLRYQEAAQGFELNPVGDSDTAAARKQIDALNLLVQDFPNDSVTPFALQRIAKAQVAIGEYEAALKTLEDLQSRFKDFAMNVLPADSDESGRPRSLTQRLVDSIQHEKQWAAMHTYVHHWPSEDRKALVETSSGSFWLGFYSEPNEAPQHVAAFIERAKRGDYNGTQVYSLIQNTEGLPEQFACGSRASGLKERGGERDPAAHDRDEPTDTIEPEDSRSTIRHQYRVVSSAKMPSGESATNFVVVTKTTGLEKLNGETTPFAAVLDQEKSLATIDLIGRSSTYSFHPKTKEMQGAFRMRDHPYPAIYIRRVTIWSKEKLEEGHTWDVTRKATNEPEPWEAELGAGPLPDEFK